MIVYSSIADVIIGFGFWLNEEVRKNNIQKIVFLSREGWFFGKVLERSGFVFLAPTEYVRTSRKVARLSLSHSVPNMLSIIDAPSADTSIKFFLQTRFNLTDTEVNSIDFNKYEIESSEVIINRKSNREKLVKLMMEYYHLYENKAVEMRLKAANYYGEFFCNKKRVMIVDIGYNGTSQKFINDLFPDVFLFGRYFATFCGAKEIKKEFCKGWMYNNLNNKKNKNWFTKNVPFFEFFFMTEEGTLLDFEFSKDQEIVCITSTNENVLKNKYIFSEISEEISSKLLKFKINKHFLLRMKSKIIFPFLMTFGKKEINKICHGVFIDDAYGGLEKRRTWL